MAGCGPEDIYKELIAAGASTVQAIGIMANMINESSLNVETGAGGTAIDNNGYPVYGLVSWNTKFYPKAHSLVTGNCAQDLKAQVHFLALTGGFTAAAPGPGGTAAEAASSFAANYENCEGCQPGGTQNAERVANAATVAGWASSGKWPKSAGTAATLTAKTKSGSSSSTQGDPSCLIGPFPHTSFCILSKSQARALVGGLMMTAGAMIMLPGLIMLAAFSFRGTGAGKVTADSAAVLEKTPGYGQAIRYARARSQNRAARAQGARSEELRAARAAGRKQARARAASGRSGAAQGQPRKPRKKGP